jgi:VWFA-related protein
MGGVLQHPQTMFARRPRFIMRLPDRVAGRLCLITALFVASAASAQQSAPEPAVVPDGKIHLAVVVTPKSGAPIDGLKQQDFTLLDNKSPRPIESFQAFTGRQVPLEILLVIDAVNAGALGVNVEREAVDNFLRAEGGQLAYPVALTVFTEDGIRIVGNFSLDGKALASSLDQYNAGTRAVGAAAGRSGAEERWKMSQNALRGLMGVVSPHRRRKIIVWISPGWPDLPEFAGQADDKQLTQLFGDVVSMATLFARARVTLYSINPIGAVESVAGPTYYKQFLDGITKPSQVDVGDLALQVLAVQSGGLDLHSSNDLAESIKECVSDAVPFYEIAFTPASADHPDEYHRLEVQIATPGLTARTRQGYYAQPPSHK